MNTKGCIHHSLIALMSLVILQATPAFADYTRRVCGGEDQANGCPVSKDIMLGCNPTIQQVIAAACTIYRSNGQKEVLDARVDRQGSHDGGRCGYVWYSVTCLTPR